MKWLDFFSIKQKLSILLIFLVSAVSYLAISNIINANQQTQNNLRIEIAQQQHLIVEQFIDAFFFARQQAWISGGNPNSSEIKKNQFLFEQNLKTMQYGGKTYLNLSMANAIYMEPTSKSSIAENIKASEQHWQALLRAANNLSLNEMTSEELEIFKLLGKKLRDKLTEIVIALNTIRDENAQKSLLEVQLIWLFTLIIGVLFAWLIARNITQPLEDIAQTATRIRLGDLQSYPTENTHHDELGTLIYQADEMRLVLSKLIRNIQQHNKQIVHSSTQINLLSDQAMQFHEQQYNQVESLSATLKTLQQLNATNLLQLKQTLSESQKNQQHSEPYYHSQLAQVNALEAAQSSNERCYAQLNSINKTTQALHNALAELEDISLKTQTLARKATIAAARSGKGSEQFTLIANQVSNYASKTATTIAEISPLNNKILSQFTDFSEPLAHSAMQIITAQALAQQGNVDIESLFNDLQLQKEQQENLLQSSLQQSNHLEELDNQLADNLLLIKCCNKKTQANKLFAHDLTLVALDLEQLSESVKVDVAKNRARKGNDKRAFPRIKNQIKVSLQQQDKKIEGLTQDLSLSGLQVKSMQSIHFNHRMAINFNLYLPTPDAPHNDSILNVQGEVVRYEQHDDAFYYYVRFHTLSEENKQKIQLVFDYFDKKSEFK